MAKDTNSNFSSIVNASAIGTNMEVSNSDLVALTVSKAEQALKSKMSATQKKFDDIQKKIVTANQEYQAGILAVAKTKESEVDVGPLESFLSGIGLKTKARVSCLVAIANNELTIANKKPQMSVNYIVYTASKSPHQQGDRLLSSMVMCPIPANIQKLMQTIKSLTDEAAALSMELLDLKRYLQNEMASLERWARGQLAEQAIRSAGGKFGEFLDQLTSALPTNLTKLLAVD